MADSQYVEVKKTDTKQSYCLILSAQCSQQAKLSDRIVVMSGKKWCLEGACATSGGVVLF